MKAKFVGQDYLNFKNGNIYKIKTNCKNIYCDIEDAQFCCSRCKYIYDGDTPCDNCDPMDI